MMKTTDVLVIGAGLAGWTAADRILSESGLRVTIAFSGSGASPYVHGFSYPIGPGDSKELLYEDTLRSGKGAGDPALVRAVAEETAELPGFFEGLGLALDEKDGAPVLLTSLGSSLPRIAMIGNDTGPIVTAAIRKKLARSERLSLFPDLRLLNFVKDAGEIRGAVFLSPRGELHTVLSRVTILAAGGYSGLFPVTTNGADLGGDGLAAAMNAGAKTRDLPFVQFEPCVSLFPEGTRGKGMITTLFFEGAVLRNKNGERFLQGSAYPNEERMNKDELSRAIESEIRRIGGTPHGGVYFDATKVPPELFDGVYRPYLDRYLKHGIDLRTAPVEVAPAAHTSLGGLTITPDGRTTLPGLLAAGECAGGLHGKNRLGGNGGLGALALGRIAGKTAVRECGHRTVSGTSAEDARDFTDPGFHRFFGRSLPKERQAAYAVRRKESFGRGAVPGSGPEAAKAALVSLRSLLSSFLDEAEVSRRGSDDTLDPAVLREFLEFQASEAVLEACIREVGPKET